MEYKFRKNRQDMNATKTPKFKFILELGKVK